MKKITVFICCLMISGFISISAEAVKGIPATQDGINALKKALRGGIIQIGKTRLMEIREVYGEAGDITDDESRLSYDYGDIRIEFKKRKKWRYWEYDSFKKAAYTDDIDDLRFDLEDGEITGQNVTYSYIRREYGEPTEMYESDEDGVNSIYYYGDIKLVFENVYVVRSWRGSVTENTQSGGSGVLGSGFQSESN